MLMYVRVLAVSTVLLTGMLAFQNCAENLAGAPPERSDSQSSNQPSPSPTPPLNPNQVKVVLTSGSTWTPPAGTVSIDSVEVWGGGGSRTDGDGASYGAAGGGAYSKIVNVSFNPGTPIAYAIGAAGQSSSSGNGTAGGDTWFVSTGTVLAKGGSGGNNLEPGAPGGQASAGVGAVKYSGGSGGAASGLGGGGGGAAGSASGHGLDGGASGSINSGGVGGLSPGAGGGGAGAANAVTPGDAQAGVSNALGGGGGGGGGGQTTGVNSPPGAPGGGGGAGGFPGGGAGSSGAISGSGFGTARISGHGAGGQITIIYTTN